MTTFDRQLSLAIDAAHNELDRLACQRGLWVTMRRWWVRLQLRRLERSIPR